MDNVYLYKVKNRFYSFRRKVHNTVYRKSFKISWIHLIRRIQLDSDQKSWKREYPEALASAFYTLHHGIVGIGSRSHTRSTGKCAGMCSILECPFALDDNDTDFWCCQPLVRDRLFTHDDTKKSHRCRQVRTDPNTIVGDWVRVRHHVKVFRFNEPWVSQ